MLLVNLSSIENKIGMNFASNQTFFSALCAVIDEEVRSLAVEVKKQVFAKDCEWIRLASARLIKVVCCHH
jgi:hypothetical protein